MADGVVVVDARAEAGVLTVPRGVGAPVGAVVHQDHGAALAVEGVAAEHVGVEVVGLARGLQQVQLVLVEAARERVALVPQVGERVVAGVVRRATVVAHGVEAAVERVVDLGVAVDRLEAGAVEQQHVVDGAALLGHVGHVDLPGQDGLAGLTLDRALAVDHEVRAVGAQARGVGSLVGAALRRVGPDDAEGHLLGVGAAAGGGGAELQARRGVAADRGQVALLVEVGLEGRPEDRDAVVDLRVGDRPAELARLDAGLLELLAARAEDGGVLVEVGVGLGDRGRGVGRGPGREQVAVGADEAGLAGGALLADGDRAIGLVAKLREQRLCGSGRRSCLCHEQGRGRQACPHDRQRKPPVEDLHVESLRFDVTRVWSSG